VALQDLRDRFPRGHSTRFPAFVFRGGAGSGHPFGPTPTRTHLRIFLRTQKNRAFGVSLGAGAGRNLAARRFGFHIGTPRGFLGQPSRMGPGRAGAAPELTRFGPHRFPRFRERFSSEGPPRPPLEDLIGGGLGPG